MFVLLKILKILKITLKHSNNENKFLVKTPFSILPSQKRVLSFCIKSIYVI